MNTKRPSEFNYWTRKRGAIGLISTGYELAMIAQGKGPAVVELFRGLTNPSMRWNGSDWVEWPFAGAGADAQAASFASELAEKQNQQDRSEEPPKS